MRNQTSIYTKLSNKYNIPYQVIEVICNSPFKFTNQIITDLDPKPVMFAYLGKIKIKKRYEEKYNARELGTGITELSTDSAEVSDPEKLHESECITEESVSDNTEIK